MCKPWEVPLAMDDRLYDDAQALSDDLVRLRHELHQHPEVGLDLPRTQERVLAEIDGLGLEISTGKQLSSVTAVLRGGHPGPAVLLRGDMDALPVTEATNLEYASKVDGVMHACGHDLHTTMLVGAARLLAAHREDLHGDIVFMFQPGEEGCDGGNLMVQEGVLDAAGRRVEAAFGMHVMSTRYPRGTFATRPGTLMAASDGLFVTVRGAGGHGSAPHLGRDPVTAAAEMVTSLQTMVTRRFDAFDPVIITVGEFHAGTKRNIIPDTATFSATIRSFSPETRDQVCKQAPLLCEQIGAAYGMEVDAEYTGEYPPTINNAAETEFASSVIHDVFGADRHQLLPHPSGGAEDFSRVLNEVPGCYVFLGAHTGADPSDGADNHSALATFDDSVLPDGTLLHAQWAIRTLQRRAENP